jgi:hypothetical protein
VCPAGKERRGKIGTKETSNYEKGSNDEKCDEGKDDEGSVGTGWGLVRGIK